MNRKSRGYKRAARLAILVESRMGKAKAGGEERPRDGASPDPRLARLHLCDVSC